MSEQGGARRRSRGVHALAVIHFPYRPSRLDPFALRDLATALGEIGRDLAAGKPFGGTVIVPFQEGSPMEVHAKLSHAEAPRKGKRMWWFDMGYDDLPVEYLVDIAGKAHAYANMVKGTPGTAASGDPTYLYEFSYKVDPKDRPKGLPPEWEALLEGEAKADNLLYSEAVALQDTGTALLAELQRAAHLEIKAGMRK